MSEAAFNMRVILKPYVSTYFLLYFLSFGISAAVILMIISIFTFVDNNLFFYIGLICIPIAFFWPFYHKFIFEVGVLSGRYTYYGIPLKKAYQRNQIACIKLISKQELTMDGYPPFTLIIELNDGRYDIIRMGVYSRSQILEFFGKTDLKFEEHHADARLV